MFVRLIRYADFDDESSPKAESLYECSRVHIESKGDNLLLFTLERKDDDVVVLHVNKPAIPDGNGEMIYEGGNYPEVYIMNNEGKTIDSYRW